MNLLYRMRECFPNPSGLSGCFPFGMVSAGLPLVGTELWQPIDGLQMAWRAVLRDLGYCARSWAVSLLFLPTVMLLSKFLRPPNGLEASLSLDRSTPGRRKMLWSPDWLSVRNMLP